MLFLAVFLGFVAESYHVHLVDEEIEKRNIESYISNIQRDSADLVTTIKHSKDKIQLIDSLSKIPGDFADTTFQKSFFNYAFRLASVINFLPDESGFLQMQSSGTLRLIKNRNITDSILKYQSQNTIIKSQQEYVNSNLFSGINILLQVTDLRKTPFHSNGNEQQIHNYINYKIIESFATQRNIDLLQKQLLTATNLITFLKKQYDLPA